jgi:hypothetical protein
MNIEKWVNDNKLTQGQSVIAKELNKRGIETFTDAVFSIGEPALAIITSSIADPIAGLAGIGMTAFDGVVRGTDTINSVRAALSYTPKTRGGKIGMNALSGALAPVGELISGAEDYLGNSVLQGTGSPFLAAAAAAVPAAIAEANPLGKIARKTDILSNGRKIGYIKTTADGKTTNIDDIEVYTGGTGEGTNAIKNVMKEANLNGGIVTLTSDAMRGKAGQAKNRKLYKSLGFTKNSGKDKQKGITEEFYYNGQ